MLTTILSNFNLLESKCHQNPRSCHEALAYKLKKVDINSWFALGARDFVNLGRELTQIFVLGEHILEKV